MTKGEGKEASAAAFRWYHWETAEDEGRPRGRGGSEKSSIPLVRSTPLLGSRIVLRRRPRLGIVEWAAIAMAKG
jgi:hypothetical protein